jgi:arylsulfatase A-like enzyme
MPTLLDALDISFPGSIDGKSLWPILKGESDDEAHDRQIAVTNFGPMGTSIDWDEEKTRVPFKKATHLGDAFNAICLSQGKWKIIRNNDLELIRSTGIHEFYDIENDPNELVDLAAQDSAIFRQYRQQLEDYWNKIKPLAVPTRAEQSQEEQDLEKERLRSLGYIN